METTSLQSSGGNFQPSSSPAFAGTSIFLGPNGIRAGWRLLMFLMIAAIFGLALRSLVRALVHAPHAGGISPASAALGEGTVLLALLLAGALMAKVERRSMAHYALPAQGAFGAEFWQGVLWGFLALTALLTAMHIAHGFSFGHLDLHGQKLLRYACAWAAAFLAVGLVEEFLFRGYALFTLTTGIGFWPAAVALSLLFGAVHLQNGGETWVGALSAGSIGLFFCFTVRRTGGLWFALGLHSMWDYSESFIYSVPDSGARVTGHLLTSSIRGPRWLTGGSVGPEGSALIFVIIAVLFIAFDRLYPAVRFPLPWLRRTASQPVQLDSVQPAPDHGPR
jgi:uncharacterized protein